MGGRRKRRKIKRQKQVARVLRTRYFVCPSCGKQTLTIDFVRSKDGSRVALIRCGTCGLYCEMTASEIDETIDVYNRVSDLAYEGRLEEACSIQAVASAEEGREGEEGVEEGTLESYGEEE